MPCISIRFQASTSGTMSTDIPDLTTLGLSREALYQLKYRGDWNQIAPLAAQIQATLLPLFGKIGLIIPMPASTTRARQPVDELAAELGRITGIPVFNNVVVKAPAPQGAP